MIISTGTVIFCKRGGSNRRRRIKAEPSRHLHRAKNLTPVARTRSRHRPARVCQPWAVMRMHPVAMARCRFIKRKDHPHRGRGKSRQATSLRQGSRAKVLAPSQVFATLIFSHKSCFEPLAQFNAASRKTLPYADAARRNMTKISCGETASIAGSARNMPQCRTLVRVIG